MESKKEEQNSKKGENYEPVEILTFDDIGLKDNLLRGIFSYGYEKPSIIQTKAIHPLINKYDIIAQAQSGTGKTATFTIGVLQRIDESINQTQAIILAHTRELAQQIKTVVTHLSSYLNINVCLSVGGTNLRDNIDELNNNPHIVIGTPGRVLDMINKKALSTRELRLFIIDEADEMLSKIFLNQIYDIFRFLPSDIQVGLFSATMTPEFFNLTKCFMRSPVQILVKKDELTLEGIKQFYINVERNEFKFDTLCDIYDTLSVAQSIIYCNSRKIVDELSVKLSENNYDIEYIHGDMQQEDRNKIMESFRNGSCRVLISTDLLARGIDIQQVSVVINYDIPNNIENYIHRIGRSGRYGRKGMAINLATYYDIKKLHEIEQFYATQIEELPTDYASII
jgi:translation initiation factor 4A